jgi:hypothetical protein
MWFDVIATARPELTELAERYGFLTGSRLDKLTQYDNYNTDINFIDMNWKNPNPDGLIEACRVHEPKYAVAGDYDEDGGSVDGVNKRAQILNDYVENVIVVPKESGEVVHVPDWCIVGYSTPTEYGGTKAPLSDYKDEEIHILGGTPHNQIELIDKLGKDVVSVDGNSYLKAATIGNKYWTKNPPRWKLVDWQQGDRVVRAYENSVLHISYALRELCGNNERQAIVDEFL